MRNLNDVLVLMLIIYLWKTYELCIDFKGCFLSKDPQNAVTQHVFTMTAMARSIFNCVFLDTYISSVKIILFLLYISITYYIVPEFIPNRILALN